MIEILKDLVKIPWVGFGMFWITLLVIHWMWKAFLRFLLIRKLGYPPEHIEMDELIRSE
jgi:hypothetical protein